MGFARTVKRRLVGVVVAVALAAMIQPGAAHASPPPPTPDATVLTAAEALAKELGISSADAQARLDRETRATSLSQDLLGILGIGRTAGTWIDDGGRLHVAVVDQLAARVVELSGGVAEPVRFSQPELEAITDRLATLADRGQADGLRSWGIDPRSNQVVVRAETADLGDRAAALLAQQRRTGAVRVEEAAGETVPATGVHGGKPYLVNGQWRCSAGFGATDDDGRALMLTAGHCVEGGQSFSYAGASLGSRHGVSYPGNDYGAVALASSMTASGLVDMYDGYGVRVQGTRVAPVGSTVCKSGSTTGWTCGTIVSVDNAVNYGNGEVVYGLTRHNACLEYGDSGGATMSGGQAQGVSSGGVMAESGGRMVCGERVGRESISFFQPIKEVLERYDARLVTA